MERYKDAFYEPFISDWQNSENWVIAGSKDSCDAAALLFEEIGLKTEVRPLDEITAAFKALSGNAPAMKS